MFPTNSLGDGSKPLVLVVDDDPDMQRLVKRFLESGGNEVLSVASGTQALQIAGDLRPDLILLDVMMAGMDGYQVCQQLQAHELTAYIPVIFLTAREEATDRARAFALGAADYLVKPVNKEALLAAVKRHLETKTRWYSVRVATDLWDDAPLPQKFAEFRETLVKQLELPLPQQQQLALISSTRIYSFAEVVGLAEGELAERIGRFFGLPYVDEIEGESIELGVLPAAFCRSKNVVVIRDEGGQLAVVISNPFCWGLDELDLLNRAFHGQSYRLIITRQSAISSLFFEDAVQVPEGDEAEQSDSDSGSVGPMSLDGLLASAKEMTPVDVVNALIADAVRRRASDLHIEPERMRIRVRYRVDGQMRSIIPLQKSLLPGVVSRIKIMSGMDPSENRKPQDGACIVRVDDREIELRISTLAGNHGEIVVARVLTQQGNLTQLDQLGFESAMLEEFRPLLHARQGMVLITGPTGSGKTTTLYSALTYVNSDDVNILTVEDPIERDIEGINQIQVHERAGRSFAATLRAMMRQDPDVIMVGEVRDLETAEIACRAALTGHLVLATLHTQHSLGTVSRLLDMGIAPYLIVSALNGVVAQRLVRRVCEGCAEPYDLPDVLYRALQERFGEFPRFGFRRGRGCGRCDRSGTRGRLGVYEVLVIDDDFRHLLSENAAPSALRTYAEERGFVTLEQDAFRKARLGLISPEEVLNLGFALPTRRQRLPTTAAAQ